MSVVDRYRERHSGIKKHLPVIIAVVVAGGFGLVVVFALASSVYFQNAGSVIPIAETNPDKRAVRSYLYENLGDPHWEEIRWKYETPSRSGATRLLLKYRSEGPLGTRVNVDMFFIENGKVTFRSDYPYNI